MRERVARFKFAGLFGLPAACALERIDVPDGRVVVIATELPDNPGVSITNFAEELATIACLRFGIETERLVWIEHYPPDPCPLCQGTGRRRSVLCSGCRGTRKRREADRFDTVNFTVHRCPLKGFRLEDPEWRPMREADWQELNLDPAALFPG